MWKSQTRAKKIFLAAGFVNSWLHSGASAFSLRNHRLYQLGTLTASSSSSSSSSSSRGFCQFPPLAARANNDTESITLDVNGVNAIHNRNPDAEEVESKANLLSEVGLDASRFRHATKIPPMRTVSPFDVFCNRELRMSGIQAIGFDMDYTLAQYNQPAFDLLAFEGAKEKLVQKKGYPKEVMDFEYDHSFWTRGLIIDTQRGNFLKTDRHKYVRVAYHGFNEISPTTRKHLYSKTFNKVISFSEKHFVNMDTLFQYVDAHLFASLVNLKDEEDYDVLNLKTYEDIYREIRECVDLCHRDGVIKDEVARNPSPFIVKDPNLVPMLKRYREDGVKLFLLTNSYWEYTSTVMNYLYYGERVDDELQRENKWLELFDIVIVGSCKPAYMLDPYLNLFRVNPSDGSLLNTDGVYEISALGLNGFLDKGKSKVFQGGNWQHLHAMLETRAGDEILYVGDHLYSDVLRSKRTLGWRSAFVVPELVEEMRVFNSNIPIFKKILALRRMRDELDDYANKVRGGMNGKMSDDDQNRILEEIEKEEQHIKEKLGCMFREWHAQFHPIWGALFNAGYQDSRFAFYVQNYACLYTSQATNFGYVSSIHTFRTSADVLPHDRLLLDKENFRFAEDETESSLPKSDQDRTDIDAGN
ncbi:hypothetical protein ACA910_003146 [Epithemia clementina (nom. ined.)]